MVAETSTRRLEVDADLTQVPAARRFVTTNLVGLASSVLDDAQLIASELVTNAVEHGRGPSVVLELHRGLSEVELVVVSTGPSPDVGEVTEWEVAPADRITGRGLGIVRAVADRVEVRRTDGRLVVAATLAI